MAPDFFLFFAFFRRAEASTRRARSDARRATGGARDSRSALASCLPPLA